jgi:ABC-type sulfate transport system permease subunit
MVALTQPWRPRRQNVLPGFGLTLGYSLFYLSLVVLIPLVALAWQAAGLGWSGFWAAALTPRAAALSLGASGWQMFFRVTLPNIRWGLLYGVLLCNARAMGEFGAVSVVSGHIRGLTDTMPLHVEVLYNDYDLVKAFAVASLLALLALVTLVLKTLLEWRYGAELAASAHR